MDNLTERLIELIKREAYEASTAFGDFHSPHEAYGVLKEEFEEWWESIKKNEFDDYELLQVVAVGFRYLLERIASDTGPGLDEIIDSQIKRWGSGA